jgi:orotate phosphoribosyltransferase
MTDSEPLRTKLLNADIIDEEGVLHHEFHDGGHGRKVHMDKIDRGSELYNEIVEHSARAIKHRRPNVGRLVVVGAADGAIDLGFSVARKLPQETTIGLRSEKVNGIVRITEAAKLVVASFKPELAVVIDDVGTTGKTVVPLAGDLQEAGAEQVEAQYVLQRQETLRYLDEAGFAYYSLVKHVLPTLSRTECMEFGDCSRGVPLVKRGAPNDH